MSLVLYRKYRPQGFNEIVGQEHVVKTLANAISSNTISHAYFFSGPRGTGKTSIARILAKAANCENRKKKDFEPCNECSSCLEIKAGRSIDLIEIDAASHRGIDDIRELKEGIKFSPTKSKYKVFIFDEAHQLTKEAANALLKTLEEPPAHAIFVLATTEIQKMIPTIISRCQRFDFRRLTLPEISKRLDIISKKESVKIEKPALELIAQVSGGSIRDAESLLNQLFTLYGGLGKEVKAEDIKDLLGLVEIKLVSDFTNLLADKKTFEAISYLNKVNEKGLDLHEFVKTLISYLRKGLILKIMGQESNPIHSEDFLSGLTSEEIKSLKNQVESFEDKDLREILNSLLGAQNKMKYSPIPQLPLELVIVEICET
ncbi:MAG: DNA polymerase III subunit gamma/tau [Patescibacteria group bacterium]|nr:DNA polymerase III subunit gamma/tau [Patescibacteria group bacterium]